MEGAPVFPGIMILVGAFFALFFVKEYTEKAYSSYSQYRREKTERSDFAPNYRDDFTLATVLAAAFLIVAIGLSLAYVVAFVL